MSKLAKAIDIKQIGRAYEQPEFLTITEETMQNKRSLDLNTILEYRLGVVLQVRTYARDEDELRYVQRNTKEMIIEEVFGEFRKPFYELEALLYQRKHKEATEKIRSITEQMFT